MSWDIFAFRLPDGVREVADVPEGYRPPSIGTRTDVMALLLQWFPDGRMDRFGFLSVEAGGHAFEIQVPDPDDHGDDISGLTFQVRGANEATIGAIADVIEQFGMRAFETGTGGRFDRATGVT